MSNKQQEEVKELIEVELLAVMHNMDSAIHYITHKLPDGYDTYGNEVDEILKCKKSMKKILNQHFDRLARDKNK